MNADDSVRGDDSVRDDVTDVLSRAAVVLGDAARSNVPLGPLTTYGVGGSAALYVEVDDPSGPEGRAQLARVGEAVAQTDVDVVVIGNGSNLLVADEGVAGIVVRLGAVAAAADIAVADAAGPLPAWPTTAAVDADTVVVTAGGAALLPVVARRSVQAGLTGFEWAVGVPGSVGGAVRMNAGGHGSDMAATLVGVRVFDCRTGEDGEVPVSALDLGYRRSSVAPAQVVTAAALGLHRGDAEAGRATLSEIVRWRRANQPGGHNAGSVFTNPPDDSAGRLIDAAGCKGLRVGSAEVSPKHANFIQVDPGGRAADVRALMDTVRRRVQDAHGVTLHAETRLVGFRDTDPAGAS